jgi:hypothetical protein
MEVTGQMKESRLEQGKKKNAQRYRYMPIPMSILFLTPLDSSPATSFVVLFWSMFDEPLPPWPVWLRSRVGVNLES